MNLSSFIFFGWEKAIEGSQEGNVCVKGGDMDNIMWYKAPAICFYEEVKIVVP
jgi:hypothetical protein